MADNDALRKYKDVISSGLFIKFRADVPLILRVLTTDPVISETEFTDRKTGEVNLSTRYAFIVYNFTEEKAQILQVGPGVFRKIGELHTDPDFGADIRKVDLKITPTGESLERRYEVQVLQNTRTLTKEMIDEARAIDLDKSINDSRGRMSQAETVGNGGEGHAKAKATADALREDKKDVNGDDLPPEKPDIVIEDIGDEPINLDEIPF